MGEVYRARDEKLKRNVAIKVLPASLTQDAERMRRFEQEAQAAGGLNHPNITSVYELGEHDGSPYIVQELLEGETLRSRLAGGALPVRKATDYAIQVARGLAAAHEKGIVHRDLKPENLFVTKDGRVKILDFGLAKLTQADGAVGPQTNLPTAPPATEPGVVMGTLGYMSPEQVKGKSADARSDIFSFGAILYEALSGARAFHRDTAAETMSAILREEPPDLSATNKNVQPGLERVVRHCLEKNPEERFHSAHDLAFDLESLSGASAPRPTVDAPTSKLRVGRRAAPHRARRRARGNGGDLLAREARRPACRPRSSTSSRSAAARSRPLASRRTARRSCTRRAGTASPLEVFVSRLDSPESRPFGLSNAEVLVDLAVGRDGRLAESPGLDPVHAHGHARAPRHDRRRHAEGDPRGRAVGRLGPGRPEPRRRSPAGRQGAAGVSRRQGPLRDRRLDLASADLAEGRRGRVPRSPGAGRRRRSGRHRRPLRKAARDLGALPQRAGARLVARRLRGVVHGGLGGIQPRAPRRDPIGPRADPRAGDGRAHGPGRLEDGRVLVTQEKARQGISVFLPGGERSATSPGSTGRSSATSRRTARCCSSTRPEKAAGPATRST